MRHHLARTHSIDEKIVLLTLIPINDPYVPERSRVDVEQLSEGLVRVTARFGFMEKVDIDRIAPSTFVGEVVMKSEFTPLLRAAKDKGCAVQVGTDMLFEMIPAYLEFFGYGTATADELRAVAQIKYA